MKENFHYILWVGRRMRKTKYGMEIANWRISFIYGERMDKKNPQIGD